MQSADPRTRVWAEAGIRSASAAGSAEPAHTALYAFDRLLALPLAICALPLIGGAAVTVALLSRRNPFLIHRRVGQAGAELAVFKIRTMWGGNEDDPDPGSVEKSQDDPRVTSRFARFCRRHSIDELPQLLQVLAGQMSLVGPRPLTREELNQYYRGVEQQVTVLRPGVSGLWQVRGRNRLTYRQRRRFDLFLVRRFCLALYLQVILATVASVVSGRDAW